MKAVVCTDMEGASGVISFAEQASEKGKYYEQARKLLTAEVNAAVEGMIEESIDDILVIDGHGAGGITFEDLHPAAKLFHGQISIANRRSVEILQLYDVGIMVGQHAMAGTVDGTLNHTQNEEVVEYYKLNGKYIGEIAQFALYCGALSLPVIFLSGDVAACREAEDLIPGITTAAVKQGLNRLSAISYPPAEARRRIREGIQQAIRKQRKDPLAPLIWQGPFVLEKRFLFTEIGDACEANRSYRRIDDKTVELRSDDILDIIYG